MALPEGVEPRSEEDWLELATSDDPGQRKIVSNVLKDMGYKPTDYISWKGPERVKKIMEAQDEDDGSSKKKGKANGAGKKSANKAAASAGKTTKKSTKSEKTESNDGGGGSVDLGPVEDALAAANQKIGELEEKVEEQGNYIKEIHMMMQIYFMSDEDAKANLEDEEIQEALYGKRLMEDQDDSEDD